MGGFQLWANLPASHKMMDPRYQDVKSGQVPEVTATDGTIIRIICGEIEGKRGPVQDVVIDPAYLDVTVPPHVEHVHPTSPGHTVFAYVFQGKACFCNEKDCFSYDAEGANYVDLRRSPWVANHSLILFDDGDSLVVSTEDEAVRFLLVSGKPIREPVAWYGPIVMNTREELRVAFDEYDNGSFIRSKKR